MKPAMKNVLVVPGKESLKDGPDSGWIEQLEANLDLVLKKYTGESFLKLTAGDKIPGQVFTEPHCLILLMHASYTSSDKYLGFIESISAAGTGSNRLSLRIDTSLLDAEKLPEEFANAVSIRLTDTTGGEHEWIGEDFPNYWSRLLDLAAEIAPLEKSRKDADLEKGGDKVYLAETTADLESSRNILKRELTEHGFIAVPVSSLKYRKADMKSYIQSQVDQSRLSIHLLGNTYGESMKGSGYSIPEVQIQFITEYLEAIENDPVHATKEINRLIWIDPEYNPIDSQQEGFITQLKRNIENLHRTEIIQTPLELFKTLVINRLRREEPESVRKMGDGQANGKFIYMLHSPDDQNEADELSGKLSEKGLTVGMLDYGIGQVDLLKDHKKHLQECDGAIILYGNTNRPWLNSKVMDLLKAPGLGRKQQLETKQVLAVKKDLLEDLNLPGGLSITREHDLSKAADELLKNLK